MTRRAIRSAGAAWRTIPSLSPFSFRMYDRGTRIFDSPGTMPDPLDDKSSSPRKARRPTVLGQLVEIVVLVGIIAGGFIIGLVLLEVLALLPHFGFLSS